MPEVLQAAEGGLAAQRAGARKQCPRGERPAGGLALSWSRILKMSSIRENIRRVRGEIADICAREGRSPDDVEVVGVTKFVPVDKIQQAVDAGLTVMGENRVQEASKKIPAVSGDVTWHMIGHLQRNKVKLAVWLFDMIQSVDSIEVAAEIDKRCSEAGRTMDVLIEVKTAPEETKFGVGPSEAVDLMHRISKLDNVGVKGLMTIGTFTDDEGEVRRCFRELRRLSEKTAALSLAGVEMRYLSMGMSSDFGIAIEEGSNMVRIGTAIFGTRPD
jgi:pyridoxal phosphate enzyme (YggS family)